MATPHRIISFKLSSNTGFCFSVLLLHLHPFPSQFPSPSSANLVPENSYTCSTFSILRSPLPGTEISDEIPLHHCSVTPFVCLSQDEMESDFEGHNEEKKEETEGETESERLNLSGKRKWMKNKLNSIEMFLVIYSFFSPLLTYFFSSPFRSSLVSSSSVVLLK